MKKLVKMARSSRMQDELRSAYRFDYSRSKPNRFACRLEKGSVVVVLAPDVASIFKDSASVNDLLRSVARAVKPGSNRGKQEPRGRRALKTPAGGTGK